MRNQQKFANKYFVDTAKNRGDVPYGLIKWLKENATFDGICDLEWAWNNIPRSDWLTWLIQTRGGWNKYEKAHYKEVTRGIIDDFMVHLLDCYGEEIATTKKLSGRPEIDAVTILRTVGGTQTFIDNFVKQFYWTLVSTFGVKPRPWERYVMALEVESFDWHGDYHEKLDIFREINRKRHEGACKFIRARMSNIWMHNKWEDYSIYYQLKKCLKCGLKPHYSKKGHRGYKVPTVMHECHKRPGSPQVIFTPKSWNKMGYMGCKSC